MYLNLLSVLGNLFDIVLIGYHWFNTDLLIINCPDPFHFIRRSLERAYSRERIVPMSSTMYTSFLRPLSTNASFLPASGASSTFFCFPPRDSQLQVILNPTGWVEVFLAARDVLLDRQPEGYFLVFYCDRS